MKKAISYAKACILIKDQLNIILYSLDSGVMFIPKEAWELERVWGKYKDYVTFYIQTAD